MSSRTFILKKSDLLQKKFSVTDISTGKTIYFGAKGYGDYTLSKDKVKKANYIARHAPREVWGKSGIDTAGFWSRWILWNEPTIEQSVRDTEKKFNIKIVNMT
jgi:hypothetical protein